MFVFIVGVVNEFEKDFFVAHVELSGDFVATQLSEEFQSLLAEVNIGPVVVLLVENLVELPLQGLSQQSHDFFEISFDIEGCRDLAARQTW